MPVFPAIGTQIKLIFSPKYQTFTVDQFRSALQERSFIMGQGQVPNSQNPQVSIPITTFSKDNVNIVHNPQTNQIAVLIINTLDLNKVYDEIKQIMFALKITSEVIRKIGFDCSTRSSSEISPSEQLTSLLDSRFLSSIRDELHETLNVSSIRLSSDIPLGTNDGYEIIIEPLLSSPSNEYFIHLIYQTGSLDEFNAFIAGFGHPIIEKIIGVVSENG